LEILFENKLIKLHLITVERSNLDFNEQDNLKIAAGGDVFNIIQSNGLTQHLAEFTSYSPNYNNGFNHIYKITAKEGYIPYGNMYFKEEDTIKFYEYINEAIQKNKDSEEEMLKIIQKLSYTLSFLVSDKSNLGSNTIEEYCKLFQKTKLEENFVHFIMKESIKMEKEGKSFLLSEYRSKLKEYYKKANEMLFANTKKALSIKNFITLPINNKILVGDEVFINENITMNKFEYFLSSIMINNTIKIPVLPLELEDLKDINEQCLRQFVRAMISINYKISALDDKIMYIMMGITTKILISKNISEKYKEYFRKLSKLMLKKKRLNVNETEIQNIENGELPDNSNINNFDEYMNFVQEKVFGLKKKYSSMSFWYMLLLGLNDKNILSKQLKNCKKSLENEFGVKSDYEFILKHLIDEDIIIYEMTVDSTNKNKYDYNCLITKRNLSRDGGFIIIPHKDLINKNCSPKVVFSQEGLDVIFENENFHCPSCKIVLDCDMNSTFKKIDKIRVSKNNQHIFDNFKYYDNIYIQKDFKKKIQNDNFNKSQKSFKPKFVLNNNSINNNNNNLTNSTKKVSNNTSNQISKDKKDLNDKKDSNDDFISWSKKSQLNKNNNFNKSNKNEFNNTKNKKNNVLKNFNSFSCLTETNE
jgi:hypothetical protein